MYTATAATGFATTIATTPPCNVYPKEEAMCPACLASAAWLLASGVSAGGLGAVAIKKLRGKFKPKEANP